MPAHFFSQAEYWVAAVWTKAYQLGYFVKNRPEE
jgi:hypothetical protein